MENDQFLSRQQSGSLSGTPFTADRSYPHPGSMARDAHHSARFDHPRYSHHEASLGALGQVPPPRPIGERAARNTPSWLEYSSTPIEVPSIELSDIPGYIPQAPPQDTAFETVPAGAGYHITADEATKVDMAGQYVLFNGNVTLSSPQFSMSSQRLKVHMSDDRSSFKLAEAEGNVHVQLTGVTDDKKYRGQSSHATFDPRTSKLILTGWPRIQGQGKELIAAEAGTKVFLYTDSGKMDTVGRAQTRIAKRFLDGEANSQ